MTRNVGDRRVVVDHRDIRYDRLNGRVGTLVTIGVSASNFDRIRFDDGTSALLFPREHRPYDPDVEYFAGQWRTGHHRSGPGWSSTVWGYHTSWDEAHRVAEAHRISSATADEQHNHPQGERSAAMYGINVGNHITNGTTRATVIAVTDAFIVAVADGAEFVLNSAAASGWTVVPNTLIIERPFVVYAADGTRVDGYKYESRARRNNDARFAGTGYWLGEMKPENFTWVSA